MGFLAACGQQPEASAERESPVVAARQIDRAQVVLEAFKSEKLPIGRVHVVTAENDPNQQLGRPGGYISKIDFIDTRFPDGKVEEATNNIEVFASEDDAKRRYDYVDGIMRDAPIFTQYLLLRRNVVVRLDQALTPDVAKEYEAALADVVG
jgi:hypothetical protein